MKIVLFALTGYGNEALKAMVKINKLPCLLITRKEIGPFPYYREKNITILAKKFKIPFTFKSPPELVRKIKTLKPDLILVASYHKIIPPEIINSGKIAINIHPSLLPKYKGATPTNWVLVNNEKFTGLTAHFLTEKVDGGKIILQKKIAINKQITDGELRQKLAKELQSFLPKLFKIIHKPKIKTKTIKISSKNYYPKIFTLNNNFELNKNNLFNLYRGLTPYPGAFLSINNEKFLIKKISNIRFKNYTLIKKINRRKKLYIKLVKFSNNDK